MKIFNITLSIYFFTINNFEVKIKSIQRKISNNYKLLKMKSTNSEILFKEIKNEIEIDKF